MDFYNRIQTELETLDRLGRRRELRTLRMGDGSMATLQGRTMVNLAGNDYLGIAGSGALRREFYAQCREPGLSAASSRLLTGNTPEYDQLEAELRELYPGRAALVFNSGYHANIGILPALAAKGDLILADRLCHASIIDGLRLGEAQFKRFPHNDYEALERQLRELRGSCREVFIVTESIFSMDGDCADLRKLAALKAQYNALLVVDEAHAVGVRGPRGAGLAAELGVMPEIDVLIGTFGKAFGAAGAYAITTPELRDYLINRMRSLIFTTGLPPVTLAWCAWALKHAATLDAERVKLRRMGERLRAIFRAAGLPTGGESQIVPLLVGPDAEAVALAQKLQNHGFLVFAIRPPTVPPGTARLRFSLAATLDEKELERLGGVL